MPLNAVMANCCTGEATVALFRDAAAPVKQPLLRGYGQQPSTTKDTENTEGAAVKAGKLME
ncbi:MAG: hypothetical protein Kow00111_10420 [Thermincola ferriacetica]